MRNLELPSEFLIRMRNFLLSKVHWHGVGTGLKPELILDADITGDGLTHWATIPIFFDNWLIVKFRIIKVQKLWFVFYNYLKYFINTKALKYFFTDHKGLTYVLYVDSLLWQHFSENTNIINEAVYHIKMTQFSLY